MEHTSRPPQFHVSMVYHVCVYTIICMCIIRSADYCGSPFRWGAAFHTYSTLDNLKSRISVRSRVRPAGRLMIDTSNYGSYHKKCCPNEQATKSSQELFFKLALQILKRENQIPCLFWAIALGRFVRAIKIPSRNH